MDRVLYSVIHICYENDKQKKNRNMYVTINWFTLCFHVHHGLFMLTGMQLIYMLNTFFFIFIFCTVFCIILLERIPGGIYGFMWV